MFSPQYKNYRHDEWRTFVSLVVDTDRIFLPRRSFIFIDRKPSDIQTIIRRLSPPRAVVLWFPQFRKCSQNTNPNALTTKCLLVLFKDCQSEAHSKICNIVIKSQWATWSSYEKSPKEFFWINGLWFMTTKSSLYRMILPVT